MAKLRKKPPDIASASGIRRASRDDGALLFSFKLFDASDAEVCPPAFGNGYTQALMDRLRSLSTWKVSEFTASRSKSIRSHKIDWDETSRPDGFAHLNDEYQTMEAWQFSVSSNEYGRVHGILIGSCFYVIWLDCNHAVYPEK